MRVVRENEERGAEYASAFEHQSDKLTKWYEADCEFERWLNFLLRVWSWRRTNAGGVPNTCKSSDEASSEVN